MTKVNGSKINGSSLRASALTRASAVPPPAEFTIKLDSGQKARVTTRKLPGAPNYVYSVYYGSGDQPILERISRPDKDDIANALFRRA